MVHSNVICNNSLWSRLARFHSSPLFMSASSSFQPPSESQLKPLTHPKVCRLVVLHCTVNTVVGWLKAFKMQIEEGRGPAPVVSHLLCLSVAVFMCVTMCVCRCEWVCMRWRGTVQKRWRLKLASNKKLTLKSHISLKFATEVFIKSCIDLQNTQLSTYFTTYCQDFYHYFACNAVFYTS